MGVFEITFEEWDACHDAGGCSHSPGDEGWGRGSRPVVNVSWKDVQEYVRWLSHLTGRRYRLPSESEWEHAARGGARSRYSWGDSLTGDRANCAGCGSPWGGTMDRPRGLVSREPGRVARRARKRMGVDGGLLDHAEQRERRSGGAVRRNPAVGPPRRELRQARGTRWRVELGTARCSVRYAQGVSARRAPKRHRIQSRHDVVVNRGCPSGALPCSRPPIPEDVSAPAFRRPRIPARRASYG